VRASAWLRVEPLINLRNHLIELRDKRIEITIGGEYQNREFVDHVAHAIRLEIRNRIVDIEAKLRELDVTVD
jgi:hypothetical protein